MTNHAVIIISQRLSVLSKNQPSILQLNFSDKFFPLLYIVYILCHHLGNQMHFELPELTDKCSNGSLILGDTCNSDPILFLQLMLFSTTGMEQFSFQNTDINYVQIMRFKIRISR